MSIKTTNTNKSTSQRLPDGVLIHHLNAHTDARGVLTEIHRNEWQHCQQMCQYNHVVTTANSLRGVHVHPTHTDYLYISSGCMHLGLVDIRGDSENYLKPVMLQISDHDHIAVTIPPGVAHGFYFSTAGSYIYGVDAYWDMADELGCQWDDKQLQLNWPCQHPILSIRDQQAGTAQDMIAEFARLER